MFHRKLSIILIVISILASIFMSGFLYKDALNAYFFQDDWFSLWISNAKSITDFINFFVPRSDVIYYRPLGMQVPFFIIRNLFGVNPIPFHLLTFTTHAINIILVFVLIRLLKKDLFVASLSAFMYGVSAAHYIPAFWSATYAFVLGPTFFFLSYIFYLLSEQKKDRMYDILALFSFLVGLLVNEMVIVVIPILLIYQIYARKFAWKKILPYLFPVLFIILLRFIVFTPSGGSSYRLALEKDVLNNLRGYLLWSFNWPEEMKAQFMNFWKINPVFIREFQDYFWVFAVTLGVSLFMFFLAPILLVGSSWKNYLRLAVFSFLWFVVGLLPVLFFTQHTFSYYLPISLVGLIYFSVSSFRYLVDKVNRLNKVCALAVVIIFTLNWTVSALFAVDFNSKIHWAPRRAKVSHALVERAKQYYPADKLESNFIHVRPSSESKLSLNDQDAFRVIYDNDDIVTIYYPVWRKLIL